MAGSALQAADGPVDEDAALALLRHGHLELEGLLAEASNATLRAVVSSDGVSARCIYKPVRGERPLWDFPDGTLADREFAAYLVSVAGGWGLVPPTVLREGPLGPGACQLWIDEAYRDDVEQIVGFVPADDQPPGWRPIADATDPGGRPYLLAHADDQRLKAVALFDAVVNNADRKGAHVLCTPGGQVYGVDHGVCFHAEDKLRTVLWGWAGEPLEQEAVDALRRLASALADDLGRALAGHLTAAERAALSGRVQGLIATGEYPAPSPEWPALPWPPM